MRVLLVDDHALMVEGLRSLLEAHGIEVVGAAADGRQGVEQALRLEPDLVLMDIRMPVLGGLAATRLIKAQRPEQKIVMLTTSAEDEDLFEAIKSGADGYLLKITSGPDFIAALQGLEQGIPPFSPGLAARLLHEFAVLSEKNGKTRGGGDAEKERNEDTLLRGRSERGETPGGASPSPSTLGEGRGGASPSPSTPGEGRGGGLTARQTEVLRLVAAGLTYKEVGAKLSLSDHTVRYHMSEIMRLIHLENRSQVIAYAGKLGLENEQ